MTPYWYGARLGVYQAHALAGPVAATALLVNGHYAIGLMLVIGSVIGWAGWKRDYNLRWRAYERRE